MQIIYLLNIMSIIYFIFFFFNDPPPTEIYTLSLHDALPICAGEKIQQADFRLGDDVGVETVEIDGKRGARQRDRKSTRLNSSHTVISYAVFCLKKKKQKIVRRATVT